MKVEMRVIDPPCEWLNTLSVLVENLWNISLDDYLRKRVRATCVRDLCLIWTTNRDVDDKLVVYEGSWIGLRIDDEVVPSVTLAEKIFKERGIKAAVVASSKSAELFLYGRDIFESGVLEKYEPHDKLVAVLEVSDRSVIGFAEYKPTCNCYRHVYDLSIFLKILG